MHYQHLWENQTLAQYPLGKVVCVGRNYAKHAKELGNPVPSSPLLFMKPQSSLTHFDDAITLASRLGEHHYEAEIALLIGETIRFGDEIVPHQQIAGIGLALDLTLRHEQEAMKQQGLPWERAKAYDNACPITRFIPMSQRFDLTNMAFRFAINGEQKQLGNSQNMLFPMVELLASITEYFTLMPGDVVLTGTPEGVGVLQHGDELTLELVGEMSSYSKVVLR